MNIRSIRESDFSQWLELWQGYNEFYKRKVPLEVTQTTWKRFLDPSEPMFALVAESEGTLVGFTHYLFHRNTALLSEICYLQDLFTAETLRRQGVGRSLIEAVSENAKAAGVTRVYWQTHETNQQAMKLYDQVAQKTGFLVYRKVL